MANFDISIILFLNKIKIAQYHNSINNVLISTTIITIK